MQHRIWLTLAALWQFLFMLDFVVPMSLGAAITKSLKVSAADLGWLSLAYTGASLLSGLAVATMLKRVPQRSVLATGLLLFALANLLTMKVSSLPAFAVCRALAAIGGGPVAAILLARAINAAGEAQRGRTIARVMMGNSAAIILGVPLSLWMTTQTAWPHVFALIGVCALMPCAWVMWLAQDEWGDERSRPALGLGDMFAVVPKVRQILLIQGVNQMASFSVIPVIASFVVLNGGVSELDLAYFYLTGGASTLVILKLAGAHIDRHRTIWPIGLGTAVMAASLMMMASGWWQAWGLLLPFAMFMAANAAKNMALAHWTAARVDASIRAVYLNIQNSVQDLGILLASVLPMLTLSQTEPTEAIEGMPWLAGWSIALMLLLLGLVWRTNVRTPLSVMPAIQNN